MAFPAVAATATGRTTATNVTSHPITLPSGISAGDLLVVFFSADQVPNCTINTGASGTKWTRGGQVPRGVAVTASWFWKVAEGSDALTITTSSAEQSSHISYRITGAKSIRGVFANGTVANGNPLELTPEDGTQDYLWLVSHHNDSTTVATAAPASFSNFQSIAAVGTASASTASAERQFNGSTLDPGTFTSGADEWVDFTLAISPLDRSTEDLQFVGGTSASHAAAGAWSMSLTDLTGGLAAAPAENDIVIVAYSVSGVSDLALGVTTAGYTEIAELYQDDTYDTNLSVSYKVMGGTPDTTVDLSDSTTTAAPGTVTIQVWRGGDTTTPMDATATTAVSANGSIANPPSITPVTTGAVIIGIGACANVSALNQFGSPDLTSNFISIGANTATNDGAVGMGSRYWGSGAYDPAAFIFSNAGAATNSWAAVTLALRPAASGAQNLVGSLFSTTNSFGAGIVLAGAVTLAGALFSEADAFPAGQVSPGAVTLTGTLFTEADTFGAGTIAVGAVNIAGSLFSEADTFPAGVVSVTGGPQTLIGALYADADTFGAGVVSPGSVSLAGALFSEADTFGAGVVVAGAVTLGGTLFSEADAFGAGVIIPGAVAIGGTLYSEADTFGAGSIAIGTVTVGGAIFTEADTFGAGTIVQAGGTQTLVGTVYADADSFGAGVVVAGTVTLGGTLFSETDVFGAGAIIAGGSPQTLTGTLFSEADFFGAGNIFVPGAFLPIGFSFGGPSRGLVTNNGARGVDVFGHRRGLAINNSPRGVETFGDRRELITAKGYAA